MAAIDVEDLKEHTSDVLRRVRDGGEVLEVIDHGTIIAMIVPAPSRVSPENRSTFRHEWTELSREIGRRWPKGVSAVDAIREQRREI